MQMTMTKLLTNCGLKVLDSQSWGPVFKPMGGSRVNSTFHPSKVDKMSTKNSWELSGKK